MKRKIIFHAGPTNSGKTYHALERFMTAKSGVYCGPLKLLATEVYKKANEKVSNSVLILINLNLSVEFFNVGPRNISLPL